jgi:hypothetical protein
MAAAQQARWAARKAGNVGVAKVAAPVKKAKPIFYSYAPSEPQKVRKIGHFRGCRFSRGQM